MIAFVVYLALLLLLIQRSVLFGLVKRDPLPPFWFTLAFFLKSLAVPVFYFVYKKMYGGIEGFDAGKFFHDAELISDYARHEPLTWLQLMFGLQDESPGTALYTQCLSHTWNWDNGTFHDLFYNDNRIVIRLHSVLSFISFGSYFAQALFNCLLGFLGTVLLYKTFRSYFAGCELWLLCLLCFFPTLWFYSGAVLKEGPTLLVMGCTAWQLKTITSNRLAVASGLLLFVTLMFNFLLKPYLLIPCAVCFFLLFRLQNTGFRFPALLFLCLCTCVLILVNFLTMAFRQKTLTEIAADRSRVFADAARGGIFLLDSSKFVRLEYDHALLVELPDRDSSYRIRQNVAFTYWEHHHQQDTLFNSGNQDTLTVYKLVYEVPRSASNIDEERSVAGNLYYSLLHPFFFNAKGPLQWLASFENLLILLSLLLTAAGLVTRRRNPLPVVVWLSLALGLCLLIGATTPNSGAIFRYRAPVVVFILLSALYFFLPKRRSQKKV